MILKDMLSMDPDDIQKLKNDENNYPIISVYKSEKSGFESGQSGCIIYCDLFNPSNQPLEIEILDSFIVNEKGEQHPKDMFLTGYHVSDEVTIQPEAYVRRGEIYIDTLAGTVCEGWRYGISVKNKSSGRTINATFQMDDVGLWPQKRLDINESLAKQLKTKVERSPDMEKQKGIRFESISFTIGNDYVDVLFDVYGEDEGGLKEQVEIKCICYDKDNDIIARGHKILYPEDFSGYTSERILLDDLDPKQIEKIKFFPE